MAFKFNILLACSMMVVVVNAGVLYEAPPAPARSSESEVETHPSYNFNYEVQDAETGDFKSQSETRDGDVVQGQYSLQDADGYQRIVEYSVNGESGFNAVVRREPLPGKSLPAIAVAAQPIVRQQEIKKDHEQIVVKQATATAAAPTASFVQPATFLKTFTAHPAATTTFVKAYSHAPALLHHAAAPTHTIIHHHGQSAVHLPATAHIVHAAPAATHPAHAFVRTSFEAPHVQYVY